MIHAVVAFFLNLYLVTLELSIRLAQLAIISLEKHICKSEHFSLDLNVQ